MQQQQHHRRQVICILSFVARNFKNLIIIIAATAADKDEDNLPEVLFKQNKTKETSNNFENIGFVVRTARRHSDWRTTYKR